MPSERYWRPDPIEWANMQPVTTRCAKCDWTHEGTLQDGREAHTAHRLEHGPAKKTRRRFATRHHWNNRHAGLSDNIANARAVGASGWASDDPEWRQT